MREKRLRNTLLWFVAGLTISGTAPGPALAQAWLPPKGEATVAAGYQYLFARDHLTLDGENLDRGNMRWSTLVCDLGYGVTDRFSVRVGVPYVISKYSGAFPHLPQGRAGIDDGAWHHTLQDIRVEARVLATTGALAVTPFVSGSLPLAGYETHAHAAAGKGIWEATAGVFIGRRLDPLLPDAFAQARVAFTVPERPLGVWHNRTNATLDFGYFLTPAVTLRTMASWQVTHGGYRYPIDAPPGTINFQHHDQLLREQFVQVGGGASFAVTGSMEVFAAGFQTLSGRNSIASSGASVGMVWGFSPAQMIRKRRTPGAAGNP